MTDINWKSAAEVTLTFLAADRTPVIPNISDISVWLLAPDGTGGTTPYTTTAPTQVGTTNVFKLIIPTSELNAPGTYTLVARTETPIEAASDDVTFKVKKSRVP